MQPEVWVMAGGALTTVRTYFHYRMKVIEHEHGRNLEIEDRREGLEKKRREANEDFMSKFQSTVRKLQDKITEMQSRMDEFDGHVTRLDSGIQFCKEWLEKQSNDMRRSLMNGATDGNH